MKLPSDAEVQQKYSNNTPFTAASSIDDNTIYLHLSDRYDKVSYIAKNTSITTNKKTQPPRCQKQCPNSVMHCYAKVDTSPEQCNPGTNHFIANKEELHRVTARTKSRK